MSQDPYTAYRTIARLGALLLVLLGSLVLLGWLWNVGFLTTVLPGRITMKPNTRHRLPVARRGSLPVDAIQPDSEHPTLVCGFRGAGQPGRIAYVVRVRVPRRSRDRPIAVQGCRATVLSRQDGPHYSIQLFHCGIERPAVGLLREARETFADAGGDHRVERSFRHRRIPVRRAPAVRLSRVHLNGASHRGGIPGRLSFAVVLSARTWV